MASVMTRSGHTRVLYLDDTATFAPVGGGVVIGGVRNAPGLTVSSLSPVVLSRLGRALVVASVQLRRKYERGALPRP